MVSRTDARITDTTKKLNIGKHTETEANHLNDHVVISCDRPIYSTVK